MESRRTAADSVADVIKIRHFGTEGDESASFSDINPQSAGDVAPQKSCADLENECVLGLQIKTQNSHSSSPEFITPHPPTAPNPYKPKGPINRRVSIGVLALNDVPADAALQEQTNSIEGDQSNSNQSNLRHSTDDLPKDHNESTINTQTSQHQNNTAPLRSNQLTFTEKNPAFTGSNTKQGLGLTRLRKMVSQKRIRFQDGNFDLDLSYITPQIIAMGLPADGFNSLFRNPISKVASMMQKYHQDNYLIINLTEKKYDHRLFNNRVLDIGWEDHHGPPLHMLAKTVIAAAQWIALRPKNVVAVHCKAGKGRTGTVIAALLVYAGIFEDPDEAFSYFSYRRSHFFLKGGTTIPSQKRTVHELCAILKGCSPIPRPMMLERLLFYGLPSKDQKKRLDAYVKILFENHELVRTSKDLVVMLDASGKKTTTKNEGGYTSVRQPGFDDAADDDSDGDDEEEEDTVVATNESTTFGTFPPHPPLLKEITLNVPLCGDYLLKMKAKRSPLLKQLNIFRLNLTTTMLLPALDANNAYAQEMAELEIQEIDGVVSSTPTKPFPVHRNSFLNPEKDMVSPAYQDAHPVPMSVTKVGSEAAQLFHTVFYRRDLDGAHKKKGFPDDFRMDMIISAPENPLLQSCDKLAYDNLVPFRDPTFWQTIHSPSVYDPLWEMRDSVDVAQLNPQKLRAHDIRLNDLFLKCSANLIPLKFVNEKKVANPEPGQLSFVPNHLWSELMNPKLRTRYSESAQLAGLLPYESDESDWMIQNLRTSATSLRNRIPFMFYRKTKHFARPTEKQGNESQVCSNDQPNDETSDHHNSPDICKSDPVMVETS